MKEPKKRHGLFGGTVSALLAIVFLGIYAVSALWMAEPFGEEGMLLLLCALFALAAIIGICIALAQRWREVRRGEEDEARKY